MLSLGLAPWPRQRYRQQNFQQPLLATVTFELSYGCPICLLDWIFSAVVHDVSGKAKTEQRRKSKQTLSNATFKRLPLNSAAPARYCEA